MPTRYLLHAALRYCKPRSVVARRAPRNDSYMSTRSFLHAALRYCTPRSVIARRAPSWHVALRETTATCLRARAIERACAILIERASLTAAASCAYAATRRARRRRHIRGRRRVPHHRRVRRGRRAHPRAPPTPHVFGREFLESLALCPDPPLHRAAAISPLHRAAAISGFLSSSRLQYPCIGPPWLARRNGVTAAMRASRQGVCDGVVTRTPCLGGRSGARRMASAAAQGGPSKHREDALLRARQGCSAPGPIARAGALRQATRVGPKRSRVMSSCGLGEAPH
jgi:hypothetical protein